jgi:mRNA interferase RelE/StbE
MWQIQFHPAVISHDLPALDKPVRKRILKAIQKKLGVGPKEYGAPLHAELFGYWKLRVDDYRVIYRIKEDAVQVLILKVGIRRDFEVYESVLKRLKSQGS